jgi:hypothetical protein
MSTTITPRAREFECELPIGHVDDDGRVHATAVLRKLTGHEESLLADRKLRSNGGRLVTELLASCVRRLGDIEPVPRRLIAELSSPDRNYLLLQLRKFTFGSEIESAYRCPYCGETTSLVQDLDELPVHRDGASGRSGIVVELEDGYADRDGEVYTTMSFRLPTGVDEEKIASTVRDNASRGMSALLARCLTAVGDMPPEQREGLGTKLVSDLTMSDRALIERRFRSELPGVDLTTEVDCEHCGRDFTANLDLTRFFMAR